MSPLSVLPGRVRYETNRLIGCKEESILFEESILASKGVLEASASYRTGRVLVRFDEKLANHGDIEVYLGRALQAAVAPGDQATTGAAARSRAVTPDSSFSAGQFVMEMALHAFLPAPLDLLLPAAATVFRR
jgi:hypothetical protein